jgi:hypothetical protein
LIHWTIDPKPETRIFALLTFEKTELRKLDCLIILMKKGLMQKRSTTANQVREAMHALLFKSF